MGKANTFKCKRCGWCCENIVFPVYNDDHERWAKLHNLDVKVIWGRKLIVMPVKCSKYKDGKCTIYKDRPEMCKTFDCEMFKTGKAKVK